MKVRLLALGLATALTLSGCTAMLERSYVSSGTHLDYSVTEDSSILRVENYQGLVNALLYFVNQHSTSGTLRLYNYAGDVESDLESACNEVMTEDPLGVFSVRSMKYDSTRILTYYEVDVRIVYSRSAQVVSSIQSVAGLSGLRSELTRVISTRQSQSIQTALAPPKISASLYPESGAQRIVELTLTWPDTKTDLEEYAQSLESLAGQLLEESAQPPYTLEGLTTLMQQTATPSTTGSLTALDALSGKPASDQGLLLGLEALLQEAGLEYTTVLGSQNSIRTMWLIVATDHGYRHLLPQSLHPDQPLKLYTDQQMTDQGYSWATSLYPACRENGEE